VATRSKAGSGTASRRRRSTGSAGDGAVLQAPERRSAILALAAEIFARKGFVATTVREIADAAGILSGSLYHHFDSKESMIDEIISGYVDEMLVAYRQIVDETPDPLEALSRLIHRAYDAIEPHRAAVTVAQNESHYLQQFERFSYLGEAYADVEELWVSVLRKGIASGVFRSDLDPKLAYLLMRDAIWVTVKWYRPGGKYTTDDLADTYTDLVLRGIRA
jgi:TetR/AcrR family transcriptional regulator, cholesterol catabolism regulator